MLCVGEGQVLGSWARHSAGGGGECEEFTA